MGGSQKKRLGHFSFGQAWLDIVTLIALITPGAETVAGVSPDPGDDQVLSCAVEGKADFIVSGDRDLIGLEDYQGIRIVTPAAFLKILVE